MLSEVDKPLYGVHADLVQYQNLDRARELDQRLAERRAIPAVPPPHFDARPVMTKYALFPMLDNRMPVNEPIVPNYAAPQVLARGCAAGYQRNVDVETDLRNYRSYTDVYVPTSQSDLYRDMVRDGEVGTGANTVHNLLSQQFSFAKRDCDDDGAFGLGLDPNLADAFHINTRARLRE